LISLAPTLLERDSILKSRSSLSDIGAAAASKILLVFAHPDDESVFAAGLIQQALKLGCHVKLITLSRGEAGSNRRGLRPHDDLGHARSRELLRACKFLGPLECQILDFPDSALSRHVHDIGNALSQEVSTFSPDFLVGFEPDGITGHADHRAASWAVSQLFQNDPALFQLLYATGHRHSSRPSGQGIELTLTLSAEECQRKIQALESHHSQFTPQGIRSWFSSDQMGIEHYFLVATSLKGRLNSARGEMK
jgi:LmbE family N-acetylglucosaminyl deacetylase